MAGRSFGSAYLRRTVRINSVRKGILGGSRFWFAVYVLRFLGRWSHKVTKRGEMPVVFSQRLQPGETLELRHQSAKDVTA